MTGAIDLAYRGYETKVSTFGDADCRFRPALLAASAFPTAPPALSCQKITLCLRNRLKQSAPYCGVGCSIYLGIRANEVVDVQGVRESPVNKGGLCVKGRFGFDFIGHPSRLTKPLIRKEGKRRDVATNAEPSGVFYEADWDEALDRVWRGD